MTLTPLFPLIPLPSPPLSKHAQDIDLCMELLPLAATHGTWNFSSVLLLRLGMLFMGSGQPSQPKRPPHLYGSRLHLG
ncbi:hypothetical protein IF2G_04652 [Cordyceps javanica]|nr:hypothetical protein IF2G_04652 [Cordyceps javanica]